MTAEIVIMNRGGVALAADSAVTIGNGSGSKIYNSVNKIFTLSKVQPIGVMIYGNAEYMGVPWETVIKLYREQLGIRKLDTVEKYAKDFLKFVNAKIKVSKSDEAMRVGQLWNSYFDEVQRFTRRELVRIASEQKISNDDAAKTFLKSIRMYVDFFQTQQTLPQYVRFDVDKIYLKYKKEFEATKALCFPGRLFTPTVTKALQRLAGLILVKGEFTRSQSGLVFAGFGNAEIFPAMYNVSCAGTVLGKLKLSDGDSRCVSPKRGERVNVIAFAQKEMVHRYMEGIDPHYADYLKVAIEELVSSLTDELVQKHSPRASAARRTRIRGAALAMVADLEKKAEAFRFAHYVSPLLDVVSVLPKEELAELAGALVNITSTKRKFAMEAETVGGPVDVAVISKGDGFIWIRRKHYFRPELNQAYLNQGLRGLLQKD